MELDNLLLEKMIVMYSPKGYDWMGKEISEENPLSIYYINEDKGKKLTNAALVSLKGKRELTKLRYKFRYLYDEWLWLFRSINDTEYGPLRAHNEMISELSEQTHQELNAKKLVLK